MAKVEFPSSTEPWGTIKWVLVPKKIEKSWLRILFDIFMNKVFSKEIIDYEPELIMINESDKEIKNKETPILFDVGKITVKFMNKELEELEWKIKRNLA